MRYAVVQCVNSSFKIVSEHTNDKQAALVKFHDTCKILWNAADVYTGMVKIIDENLDTVDCHMEFISHPKPEPEPEAEPVVNDEGI